MKKYNKTFIHEITIYSFISLFSISFLIVFLVIANKDVFYLYDKIIELKTGSEYSINTAGYYNTDKLHYKTSNEDILTIDNSGVIHAKKTGYAVVTVSSKHKLFKTKIDVNVSNFNVYSINFEEDKYDLKKGEETFIEPIINNNANIKSDLEWKSSDDNIVSVSSNGTLKAVEAGSAIILVTDKGTGLNTSITINVVDNEITNEETIDNNDLVALTDEDIINEEDLSISVEEIKLNTTKLNVYVDDIKKISATVLPSNATDKTLSYSSSDSSIAEVNKNGYIIAKKKGICNVFVTSSDGNVTASLTVNVIGKKIEIKDFKIAEDKLSLDINETYMLTKKIYPENASDQKITDSVSNPRVVSVEDNGKVKAKYPGTATIVAVTRDNHIVSSLVVEVSDKTVQQKNIKKYEINKNNKGLIVGENRKLDISLLDEYNKPVKYILTSSNSEIASIDQKGNLKALKSGIVRIDIETTDGGFKDQIIYTVLPGEIQPEFVYFNRKSVQLSIGNEFELKAFVLPEISSNKEVVWSSSNGNIATVDESGKVKAVGVGTAYIVAQVKGTSIKNSMRVSVVNKEKLIDIRNKKLSGYCVNFKVYDKDTNFMRAMQNFAIWNKGSSNEHIIVSFPTRTLLKENNKLTGTLKKDLLRTIVVDIPKSEIQKPGSKDRRYMFLNNSGHGQSIDIENNGRNIWTNGNGYIYQDSSGTYWGDNVSIVQVKYKENKENSKYSPSETITIKNGDEYYTGLELSFDLDNNLAAIKSGRQVFIYKASDLAYGKKTLLYSFTLNAQSIDGTSYPRQGFDISNGYYYQYRGYAKTKMYIEVYNYVGELQYVYVFNPNMSNQEGEGLKVYDDSIYIGITSNCKGCNGKINGIYYFK